MQHRKRNMNHDGGFGSAIGAFVATLLIAKLAWGWLVPVLFAGALASGAISASLPWSAAALIAVLVAAVVFFIRHPRRHEHSRRHAAEGASSA